ncbi:DUF1206 domain-containing protein [Aquipuribacter nitratireducens]|uniref:DUF1206 domain-containing protein n=1 Tax=Aquipuribacter nitratireducens TaxID=650104 RepID=A0ABW0GNQ9_9MICO
MTPSPAGASGDAREAYEDVKDSDEVDALQRIGRYGYVVYGVFHVALAVLIFRLAFGGGGDASTSGALRQLAQQPFGMVLIWAIALGLVLLVLWQAMEAVLDPDDAGGKGRAKAAGRAVGYGIVAFVAVRLALSGASGGGSSGGSGEETLTARLLQLPAGQLLVGAVGVGILVVAGYHVYKGYSRKYMEDVETLDLSRRARKVVDISGRVGYPAKGVAYATIGVLFLLAALRGSSEQAGGLDEGLSTLRDAPFGPYLIALIGLGFALFGVYCLARARSAGDATGFV